MLFRSLATLSVALEAACWALSVVLEAAALTLSAALPAAFWTCSDAGGEDVGGSGLSAGLPHQDILAGIFLSERELWCCGGERLGRSDVGGEGETRKI